MSASTTEDARKTDAVATKLRPTLFVGLGGTGKEVLLRLRRRILQNDWGGQRISDLGRFPIASFMYFDTDTTDAIESDRSQRSDSLARAVAFRENEKLQKRVDIRHYMNELDTYPLIQAWLPEADLSSINTEKGAGQVRAISRLLFFDQFKNVQTMLREKGDALLNSVGRQNDLAHLNLDIEHQLRIVVVCSAAGGTGSGSFIDFGLAARSMRNPRPAQTDLVLLLPGGFKGANYQRVNANAFAALMELEHVMRPQSQPPYATRWTEREGPLANLSPYDDVFLVDSRNVLLAGTDKIDQIYDMVADILFEDFGGSEFAARKRSISPNQAQFKVVNYLPPLSPKVGEKSLSYSCAYSSFGQSTIDTKAKVAIDTAVAQSVKAMVSAYFNVAASDSGRLPTPEERDRFLAEEFLVQPTSFEELVDGIKDRNAINEFALVDALLLLENGETVSGNLTVQVHATYESAPFQGVDLKNLPVLARQEFDQRRADILGGMEHSAAVGPSAALVGSARQRMARRKRGSAQGGVRNTLFAYLDNRARGGLDYTIRLVEDSKLRLDSVLRDLAAVEQRYTERAEETRQLFERSLENLKEAVAGRFLLGPDRKAIDRYLEHLRVETAYYATMLLRRQAAVDAALFLREMSEELGTRRGVDAEGQTQWDGAIAELVHGRRLVKQTLDGFDGEIALLRDAVARVDAGTYVVLPDADAEADAMLASKPAEIEQWAQEAFRDEGGSRRLFPVLEDDVQRTLLLGKLRGFALRELTPRAQKLRTIHDILLAMNPKDRVAIFEKAMVRAMPWLNAGFGHLGDSIAMADRYKLLIAVEDRTRFSADFDREIRQVIPTGRLGFQHYEVVSSGLRNRIIIYCELSGVPLDCIEPLRADWRDCYRAELPKAFPLHNHRQSSRFPNPVVPTGAEIDEMRAAMSLFLRAVCFGIVRRASGPEATYQMHIGMGDWVDIGTERDIRAAGFASASHRQNVRERVERFERGLAPLQLLAASALLDWTGKRAYAARLVKIGPNQTDRVPGLVQRVALEVGAGYMSRFRATPGARDVAGPEDVKAELLAVIMQWTDEVADSVDDTDPMDASRDPSDIEAVRAVNKRCIAPAQFTPEALQALIARPAANVAGQAGLAQPAPAAAPPNIGSASWYVSEKRQVTGPFGLDRLAQMVATLKPATNVLQAGTRQWIKLRDVPQLLALIDLPPPPPDDDEIPPPPDD